MNIQKEQLEKSLEFLHKEILDSKIRVNQLGVSISGNSYHPIARIVKEYRSSLKKLAKEIMEDLK